MEDDSKYYGGTTKISSLEIIRSFVVDGRMPQFDEALERAGFPDINFIRKLSEKKALKIYKDYTNLYRNEIIALCIFSYKKIQGVNNSDKTPFDSINLALFMRESRLIIKYGFFILFLLGAIRQLPRIKSNEIKFLYVISELEDAHINPIQNWEGNIMSWPSFTCAYIESEARIMVKKFKNPAVFKVSGDFCAYNLAPFSNDSSTEFIVLEPDTRYLVTKIVDRDDIFGLKTVSVSVQPDELPLDNLIRFARRAPPKPKVKSKIEQPKVVDNQMFPPSHIPYDGGDDIVPSNNFGYQQLPQNTYTQEINTSNNMFYQPPPLPYDRQNTQEIDTSNNLVYQPPQQFPIRQANDKFTGYLLQPNNINYQPSPQNTYTQEINTSNNMFYQPPPQLNSSRGSQNNMILKHSPNNMNYQQQLTYDTQNTQGFPKFSSPFPIYQTNNKFTGFLSPFNGTNYQPPPPPQFPINQTDDKFTGFSPSQNNTNFQLPPPPPEFLK